MDKYYKILGLPPGASKDELKKAYRRLATQHHPDKGGNAESFKEVSKAYDLLIGKRQLSRYERQEQEVQQRQQQSYQWQEPTHRPYIPPKPKPQYHEYERDIYKFCRACDGHGQIFEFCKKCDGTGNYVRGDESDNVIIGKCQQCQRGKKLIFTCEDCQGRGKIFEGKVKEGCWR